MTEAIPLSPERRGRSFGFDRDPPPPPKPIRAIVVVSTGSEVNAAFSRIEDDHLQTVAYGGGELRGEGSAYDVMVVDLEEPDALSRCRLALEHRPECRILGLTSTPSASATAEAVSAGVRGIAHTGSEPAVLHHAARVVARDGLFLDPWEAAGLLVQALVPGRPKPKVRDASREDPADLTAPYCSTSTPSLQDAWDGVGAAARRRSVDVLGDDRAAGGIADAVSAALAILLAAGACPPDPWSWADGVADRHGRREQRRRAHARGELSAFDGFATSWAADELLHLATAHEVARACRPHWSAARDRTGAAGRAATSVGDVVPVDGRTVRTHLAQAGVTLSAEVVEQIDGILTADLTRQLPPLPPHRGPQRGPLPLVRLLTSKRVGGGDDLAPHSGPVPLRPHRTRVMVVVEDGHPALDTARSIGGAEELHVQARAVDSDADLRRSLHSCDVLVISLDRIESLARCRMVLARRPEMAVLGLTSRPRRAATLFALTSGVRGILHAASEPALLQFAVRVVARGGVFVDPWQVAPLLVDVATHGRRTKGPCGLTVQELLVVALQPGARTNREIAALLVTSEETVKTHVRNAMRKLQASSRTELEAKVLEAER